MDLAAVREVIETRATGWRSAGITWKLDGPTRTAKPAMWLQCETAEVIAHLIVWSSGEAELTWAESLHREPVIECYEITSAAGLDACLDDLEQHFGMGSHGGPEA